jgi:hypothetical protein
MFSFISTTGAAYKPRVDRPISAVMSCPKLGCASARLAMKKYVFHDNYLYLKHRKHH